MQTLNMTNLAKTVGKYVDIEPKRIRAELKKYILPRLDFLGGIHRRTQRYYVIEEGYVEPEWKDMVSIHYQCQLVKDFENRINGLDIGTKRHSGRNLGISGVDNAIC